MDVNSFIYGIFYCIIGSIIAIPKKLSYLNEDEADTLMMIIFWPILLWRKIK